MGLLCSVGCGRSGGRTPLEGTVTFDGAPLPEGTIEFQPIQGTGGPSTGGPIVEGEFRIDPGDGVKPGKFRVSITAQRSSGKTQVIVYTGEEVEIPEQYLPAKYNQRSELEVEVKAQGNEPFVFDLKSE